MNVNIQNRKIQLIRNFLKLESEQSIDKFEELMKNERVRLTEEEIMKPMTIDELNSIIDSAGLDDKEGRLTSARQVKNEIGNWK